VHAIDAAAIGQPGCATHTYLMRSIVPFVREPVRPVRRGARDKPGAQDPLAGSPALNFLTGEGGFLQVFTNGLTGLRWRSDRVHVDPMLPPQLGSGVALRGLHWQGRTFDITVGPSQTTLTQTAGTPFAVESREGTQTSATGASVRLRPAVPTWRPPTTPLAASRRRRARKSRDVLPRRRWTAAPPPSGRRTRRPRPPA
jgi:hypothetical protein